LKKPRGAASSTPFSRHSQRVRSVADVADRVEQRAAAAGGGWSMVIRVIVEIAKPCPPPCARRCARNAIADLPRVLDAGHPDGVAPAIAPDLPSDAPPPPPAVSISSDEIPNRRSIGPLHHAEVLHVRVV